MPTQLVHNAYLCYRLKFTKNRYPHGTCVLFLGSSTKIIIISRNEEFFKPLIGILLEILFIFSVKDLAFEQARIVQYHFRRVMLIVSHVPAVTR